MKSSLLWPGQAYYDQVKLMFHSIARPAFYYIFIEIHLSNLSVVSLFLFLFVQAVHPVKRDVAAGTSYQLVDNYS